MQVTCLKSREEWIHGTEFIREKEIKLFELKTSADVETEFKISCLLATEEKTKVKSTGLLPNDYFKNLINKAKLHEIIDISRFSKLKRLLNVTAYVKRFVSSTETEDLSAEDLEKVKLMWIASEQRKDAQENKERFTKTANNLNFILDNDIIRCKGRIANADLPYSTKFPIYLPANSYFTQLFIKDAHDEVYHKKVTATLTQVRTEYWMPRGRQIVKKVISNCRLCRLYDSSPYKPSAAPDLPRFRVEIVPPFHNTGTDHVGPLFVKNIYSESRVTYKCYIALFSSCVTRMVHLEIQPDLEAPSTIRAMKRTFARVGEPKLLISDNHKTYRSKLVSKFARERFIKWKNILDLAPNWGGFYERMNSLIKGALRKTLKNAKLNYEELETIIVEIEAVINSRPISYIHDDELLEPLTPSHLMYGRRLKTHSQENDLQLVDNIPPTKRVQYTNRL